MLSFEDFFIKKKIDLSALQSADPNLYGEFREHYATMGEKSFDHSKKFWFNKLRKSYLLLEIEKDLKTPILENKATSTSPSSSTDDSAVKPTGFKPTFKIKPKANLNVDEVVDIQTNKQEEGITKPAGFKPRFKPGVTKTSASSQSTTETTPEETVSNNEVPSVQEKETENNKPAGFKPRFKAGVTKSATSSQSTTETTPQETVSNNESPSIQEKETENNKPAGFKPRFKAGVTKVQKDN